MQGREGGGKGILGFLNFAAALELVGAVEGEWPDCRCPLVRTSWRLCNRWLGRSTIETGRQSRDKGGPGSGMAVGLERSGLVQRGADTLVVGSERGVKVVPDIPKWGRRSR